MILTVLERLTVIRRRELYAALAAARGHGILTVLATGRVLEDVQRACEELSPFDAVVAENGAVIYLCGIGRTIQLGQPPPEHFLGELRAQGVPFHTGAVIIGTWEQHANKLLELVRRFGIDGQLVFNRAALMLLPSGINKAMGIRRAFGVLSEQLIEEGYQVCIIDPEGDYAQMRQRPKVVTFGHDLVLPSPGAAARLLSSVAAVLTHLFSGCNRSSLLFGFWRRPSKGF